MRKFTKRIRVCPRCGGVIIVNDWFQYARQYRHSQRMGTVCLAAEGSTSGEPMDQQTAFCEDCGLNWGPDDFYVDQEGRFWDQKYGKETT